TPTSNDGNADLTILFDVAKSIGKVLKATDDNKIIVSKSTVPVGTCEKIKQIIALESGNNNFDVVSNPEFLKEGTAVRDFMHPDRIVIGCDSKKAEEIMKKLYEPFKDVVIVTMDVKSSEMTKYAANAFLAMRISFINEIANLCEKIGANIENIRQGIGYDKRIGHHFLYAGIGWGGSCFPKDVKALIKMGEENGVDMKITKAVHEINERQKRIIIEKVKKHFKDVKGKKFALWGLAFKPETDDMREAPSITIINELLNLDAKIVAYDPVAIENAKVIFNDKIEFVKDKYEAVKDVNGLMILTEWEEFKKANMEYVKNLMKNLVIFDGRNILEPNAIRKIGFVYYGIGR
ncbi:MAG: UDP-glucose dehydrogenase family protein, partial [Fervidobacterium sp.]